MSPPKNLDSLEVVAYNAKNTGIPVYQIENPTQVKALKNFLFGKIKTITGVDVGTGEVYFDLSDEMLSFILSVPAFRMLTLEELVTAFRMNAAGQLGERVEHYNALINCDYVGKVLEKYVKVRSSLEDKISRNDTSVPQIEYVVETDDEKYVETVRKTFLITKKSGLIPARVYQILTAKGDIDLTTEEKDTIRQRVVARLENQAISGGSSEIRRWREVKANKRNYEIRVRNECMSEAVAIYFLKEDAMDNF